MLCARIGFDVDTVVEPWEGGEAIRPCRDLPTPIEKKGARIATRQKTGPRAAYKSQKRVRPFRVCAGVEAWLIDTGCGHDLVSPSCATGMDDVTERVNPPPVLHTATGPTPTHEHVRACAPELDEKLKAYA